MATSTDIPVSRYQLAELMSLRREEGVTAIREFGGTDGLGKQLNSNLTEGLDNNAQDLEARRVAFGRNFIKPNPPKSFLALCLDAIQDKTLIILMVAAVASLILGLTVEEEKNIAWIDGAAILAAVVIVVLVTALNDWTKERQFRGLQKRLETDSRFSVIREGAVVELPLAEIVVGDVAQFKYGNTFPVDGVLIQGFDVKVDEASLTGESELQKKSPERDPMLLAGTQVMEGGGTMLVTAVGEFSQQGIIVKLLTQRSQDEGGFITLALRRWRKKLCGRCLTKDEEAPPPPIHSPSVEDNLDDKKDLEIEEIQYDPDKPIANGNDGEPDDEEEAVPEPPLTGGARFNPLRQYQRRKRNKALKKKKKKSSEGVESTSVLQKKLNKLAVQIGYAGTAAAILCVLVLTLKFVIEKFGIRGESWDSSTDLSELLHFFIIGIIVLVVAVPEGLPLAVTIALAFSVKKMLKDNNLVRHLHACETMGNATAICSDKTGTLTTNRMTVVESYFCGVRYEVTPDPRDLPEKLVDVLKLNIAVNSSYTSKLLPDTGDEEETVAKGPLQKIKSFFFTSKDNLLGQGLAKQLGNVTECALLGFLVELGVDYDAIRDQHPTEIFTKVFTFNSSRKSMSTIIPLPGGGYRLLTKGASEIVLNKCTTILAENGRIAPLTSDDKKHIVTTVVQSMASNALRTIALAYKDFPTAPSSDEISMATPNWDDEENIVSDLTCIGVVGIQDPVRPEVPGCIASCQKAGITVRMVTGDNVDTARAIALKCGIITKGDGYLVVDGKEFNKRITDSNGEVSQDKFDRLWPRLRVLARSSPTDKYTLVDGMIRSRLHKNREVVAVTGDGTNDGPALKRADVGFAMGIAGTDVAKEACDIILTDDNFASIVKAVTWGRNVYDSISKFIQFQLTVNIVAVTLTLIAAFSIGDSPLRALQLLWVNLIMDTLASLALATEAPTPELLKRKPYGRNKALISRQMTLFLTAHSIYQLTVLLVILFAGPNLFDIDDGKGRGLRAAPSEHYTLIFNTFVFFQIFNEINARKIHGERNVLSGIWKNWIFLIIIVGQVTVQALIVEFGGRVFSTSGLPADLWMWCIFLGSIELLVAQVILFIPVKSIPLPWKHVEVPEEEEDVDSDPLQDEENRARYLWLKSLTRLRTQIRVVNAFRAGMEQGSLAHIPQIHGTPRSARYNRPVTGMETAV